MAACPSCGEANPARARFCLACGTPLTESAVAREMRKTVTIVFTDLTDSTPLGEQLDAETYRRVLSRYFIEVSRVLERHGGTVEKFIGDAVMAVFGIPELHEDDALRAVRAATELREALARLNDELGQELGVHIGIRVGLNTGEVVAGDGTGGQMPGTGKSRLAAELTTRLRDEAHTVSGRCLPYGDGITFWPLVQIIGALGSEDGVREILAGAEDAELVAERVLSAIGSTSKLTPGSEMFWAVRRLFEELAREQPVVVMFEDIHWAAPTLLDLLEYLAGWTHDAPVLLLCLARPDLLEERHGWLSAPKTTGMVLGPLTDTELEQLLDEIAQEWPLDAAARARITEAADGNPLYVEQMAAMLAEGGSVEAIPPTIHALLAARLDRLPADERAVLERAAVAGKDFVRSAVLQLLDEGERTGVDARLLS